MWSPRRATVTKPPAQAPAPVSELVTEEEDEVMEEGQVAEYAPNVSSEEGDEASGSSGSKQHVWTLEDDFGTDMGLLPARRTGMQLRHISRVRSSQGSDSGDGPRYDPGSPISGSRR